MPPVASTWSKYASAPQLSVSPICAYGPDRARSPQATIGDFAPAALAPEAPDDEDEDELQPARAPATTTGRVRGMRVCLRIGSPPEWPTGSEFTDEERIHQGRGPERRRARVEDEP